MSVIEKKLIISLGRQGMTVPTIFKEIGCIYTQAAIRQLLKLNNIKITKHEKVVAKKDRPCSICKKIFVPKYSDGKSLKYKTCSSECANRAKSIGKLKYTEDQIQTVISLKKQNIPNKEIVKITKININKVKEIIKKYELFLPKEIAQKNAFEAKLKKEPGFMSRMRESHMKFSEKEYKDRILKIAEDVRKGLGTITGIAPSYGINPNSAVYSIKNMEGYQDVLNAGISTGEVSVGLFIENAGLSITRNTRKIIPPKELDIFIPSLNLAIEYCGLFWHSEESGKTRSYHHSKLKEANKAGIRLITIFEDEWLGRQDQVKNFLLSVLNKNEVKVFGRKTIVKTIDKDISNQFYDNNHIQGRPGNSLFHLGLFTDSGLLVGCMSFGPHHRGGSDGVAILNRLAFLHNHTVHGGASKLLSYAISHLKILGYSKIISWSDNRWSEGDVYEKLGFVLEEELGPDYSYVTARGERFSKQSCQKKHLLKKGAVGKTEPEMATSLGYSRIWDCGKKRWIYTLRS